MLLMSHGDEGRERMNRSESGIARRDAVSTFAFQVIQVRNQISLGEVCKLEIHDGAAVTSSEEAEQQRESVAIAADSNGTEAACERHVLHEEHAQRTREVCLAAALHRAPPVKS
jgi:hypothetical protein